MGVQPTRLGYFAQTLLANRAEAHRDLSLSLDSHGHSARIFQNARLPCTRAPPDVLRQTFSVTRAPSRVLRAHVGAAPLSQCKLRRAAKTNPHSILSAHRSLCPESRESRESRSSYGDELQLVLERDRTTPPSRVVRRQAASSLGPRLPPAGWSSGPAAKNPSPCPVPSVRPAAKCSRQASSPARACNRSQAMADRRARVGKPWIRVPPARTEPARRGQAT